MFEAYASKLKGNLNYDSLKIHHITGCSDLLVNTRNIEWPTKQRKIFEKPWNTLKYN